jgi:hypothetical protein
LPVLSLAPRLIEALTEAKTVKNKYRLRLPPGKKTFQQSSSKPFWIFTNTTSQKAELHNGVTLSNTRIDAVGDNEV